ncbi:protein ALEX-like [Tripterygium wilfordii]|uniref:protein ALEX-like n=1 Tax=Tripterygium wilfordii TaxID=458696 RepID=UPI0018F7F1B8|nr:protein ALEX-like [Tripterygium wilfordii]
MDNYSYNSYAESGESSPRSREVDFENPPPSPWEDQQNAYKAKFMCSYGGKIHPRPNDNQLSYIGGDTKILAVDRNIKFSAMINKLSALYGDTDVSFKYQLPGEDLDALISVTSDDDLEHMMHEYDRLFRALAKPARMRLFLFTANPSHSSFGSDLSNSDRERFVEALNSGPTQPTEKTASPHNVADFLFGLEKGVPVVPPPGVKIHDPVPEPVVPPPEMHVVDDRVMGPDRAIRPDPGVEIQRQLHELQRLQLREQEQAMYGRKIEDNNFGNEYYVQKMPEKAPAPNMPVTAPPPGTAPPGYWSEKHIGGYSAPVTTPAQPEQPVYMISAPGPVYTSPVMGPATTQTSHGYYAMQRVNPEVSREQQMYNVHLQQPQHQPQPHLPQPNIQAQPLMGVMRPPSGGGMGVTDTGYAPVAVYDSNGGRQVYYAAPGGVMTHPPPYHGGVGATDMRHPVPVGLGQEGKVVTKVSQA